MDVVVKNEITTLPNPKNFIASIEDNRVCYSFDIDKTYSIKETKFDFDGYFNDSSYTHKKFNTFL